MQWYIFSIFFGKHIIQILWQKSAPSQIPDKYLQMAFWNSMPFYYLSLSSLCSTTYISYHSSNFQMCFDLVYKNTIYYI